MCKLMLIAIDHYLRITYVLIIFIYIDSREMEKSWTVVKFKSNSDNEVMVEAVPTRWIMNNMCFWPPYPTDKIQAVIRKNEEINTCWPQHKVEIFRNATYSDYLTARKKAKRAEATSDLNSDADELIKRKITKKKFSSSDENSSTSSGTDDEVIISNPPCLEKANVPRNKKLQQIQPEVKPSNHKTALKKKGESQSVSQTLSSRQQPTVSCSNTTDYHSNIEIQAEGVLESSATTNDRSDHEGRCRCNCPLHPSVNNEEYFQLLIKKQSYLSMQMSQLQSDLRELTVVVERNKSAENVPNTQSLFNVFEFPLKNVEEVEEYLKIDNNFKSVVTEMSKIGGNTVYEFIKRALQLLLSNELASEYSWLGAKKKKIFKNTKIADVLLASAQLCMPKCTHKETEEAIKNWLRRAKERCNNKISAPAPSSN